MLCPFCKLNDNKVIDSRLTDNGQAVRRRRQCLECGKRFTTYERVEETSRLIVIKRNGKRDPFDAKKMMAGVHAACGKRAVSVEDRERVVKEVEEEIHQEYDREVPSEVIGKRLMAKLRPLDKIAYLRFASEYMQYADIDELAEEVRELQDAPPEIPTQADLFTEPE
ncbi:MAG: transcriptional regulator NrdR [Phycisphaerales bacterium JB038]